MSRVAETGKVPQGLCSARHDLSARRNAEAWACLKHLSDGV